ncbi:serine/threonine-protein kinase [Streptomyces sp. B6B3]|uniref:WD40 repeat domain-containing serine/threonine protein kinase n=1 Tax=Streptomyces sp. B6B3 TaxID=3153570 RepID=UPI00325DEEF7
MELAGAVLADRYQLLEVTGRGGMGEVWRGRDRSMLRRDVAVKVLPVMSDTVSAQRFEREAAVLAKLQHPGITVVHDAGRHQGYVFIVMELLHGQDLARLLAAHPGGLPVKRVLDLSGQIAGALATAHAAGVVHRDLKPANVFVQAGDRLKICDFGIARSADASDALTTSGAVIGTPGYMSPEQCQGQPTEAPTDLYALGIVIHELLTGNTPFAVNQPLYTLMRQHVEQPPPHLDTLRPDLPAALADVVTSLLAKNPHDRPDALDLLHRLAALGGDTPTEPSRRQQTTLAQRPSTTSHRPTEPGHTTDRTPTIPDTTYTLRYTCTVKGALRWGVFSPDSRTLAVGCKNGVQLWDTSTGNQLPQPPEFRKADSLHYSTDGRVVALGDRKVIRILDAHTGQQLRELPLQRRALFRLLTGYALSSDARLLAVADDKGIQLRDVRTGVEKHHLPLENEIQRSVLLSPNGRKVASAGWVDRRATLKVWDCRTGAELCSVVGDAAIPSAFSPDGKALAVTYANTAPVRLIDPRTGDALLQLSKHPGKRAYVDVAFAPHGDILATGANGTVHIWDAHSGEQRHVLAGHTARVRFVIFAPDGHTLASGDDKGTIHVWNTAA